jgi:hypothetical protein
MTARTRNSATGEDVARPQPAYRLRAADRSQTSGRPEAEDRSPVTDRITIGLLPKVSDDLQRLQDMTSMSKTDIVNRAVTMYEFIEDQLRAGRDLLIRDSETQEIHKVMIVTRE